MYCNESITFETIPKWPREVFKDQILLCLFVLELMSLLYIFMSGADLWKTGTVFQDFSFDICIKKHEKDIILYTFCDYRSPL